MKHETRRLYVKDTLKMYWDSVRHYKLSFFVMLTLIPIGALMIDSLLPYFLSQAIGALANGGNDTAQRYLFIGGLIGATGALCNFIGFRTMAYHEASVATRLRRSVFEKLLAKDISFFNNSKIGAMTGRYIDFVRAEVQLQDLFIIRTLGFILSLGSGLILLALHSYWLSLIILGFVLLLVIQIRWSTRYRATWRHERKELVSEINGHVADGLTNSLVVKTFAAEDREIEELQKLTQRHRYFYRKDHGFIAAEGSLRVALMVAIQVGSIILAIHLVSTGALDIALAIFILAYLQRLGSQIFVLGEILNNYDNSFLDADPMTSMLLTKNNVIDKPDAKTLITSRPNIEINNISFAFNDSPQNVLKDITVSIPYGQKVGLVGHSGAGKTTITQLLLRFYDVTKGSITIDSHDIRDITQTSLRENIAYVPQEPLLFHRTLRENIAYGKPNATDKEIIQAAKKAHAYEFIERLPNGLDTIVGERGIKLSGGQRQRVAIARAILKNSPVVLLDEATSALDSESEKVIQDSFEKLMQHHTAIVIAHRLSTIQKMDRIIVLEKGKIVEDGSHKELLAQKGVYANLWSHQSGGFIKE